jgi:hypothetical protein
MRGNCFPNSFVNVIKKYHEKETELTQMKLIMDSFHLCLFDFPFIYQFYSIMTTLVKSTC